MPNHYFQFKQFTIHQDRCAMKVCTDACILGAWFAPKIPDHSLVLDLGSGTGLLMMMLAQQSNAEIHGIEIELEAFKQLRENISQNEWKKRFQVFPGDARSYSFPARYDFIISNPPFFERDLLSSSEENQVARHTTKLGSGELIRIVDNQLLPHGSFGVLLPYHRQEAFTLLSEKQGFYLKEALWIKQSPAHDYFRAVMHFSRQKENHVPRSELVIRDDESTYSSEFTEMMKPYYLYL